MEERNYIVYKYTNKENGLIYIGITSVGLEKRWANGYKANPRLYNAILKYGKDGFNREILYANLTKDEAFQLEIDTIAKYDATNREIGYNISVGGTAPMYNRHHSEETKKKFSDDRMGNKNSFYGKRHTKETIEKIKEAKSGKHLSEEHKKKIGESLKGKMVGELNPSYGVHRYGELNGMYGRHHTDEMRKNMSNRVSGEGNPMFGKHHSEDAKEKMRKLKIGKKHTKEHNEKIGEASRGRKKSEETLKLMSEKLSGENNPMYGKTGKDSPRSKAVDQYTIDGEFIKTWENARIAGDALGFKTTSGISACCLGKLKQSYGYVWKYHNEK